MNDGHEPSFWASGFREDRWRRDAGPSGGAYHARCGKHHRPGFDPFFAIVVVSFRAVEDGSSNGWGLRTMATFRAYNSAFFDHRSPTRIKFKVEEACSIAVIDSSNTGSVIETKY